MLLPSMRAAEAAKARAIVIARLGFNSIFYRGTASIALPARGGTRLIAHRSNRCSFMAEMFKDV